MSHDDADGPIWEAPTSVHTSCTPSFVLRAAEKTRASGGTHFELQMIDVTSTSLLVQRFVKTFSIPFDVHGLDGVITTACDLDWIHGARIFSVSVLNIDRTPIDVLKSLVVSLVNIADRARSGGDHYTVLFPVTTQVDQVVGMLAEENRILAEMEGGVGDIHPIPVFDHRNDPPTVR